MTTTATLEFLDNLDTSSATSHPELLISAVLHLMSCYKTSTADREPCIKLASIIERHLKALADLPVLTPVLRATCQQLSEQWAEHVDQALATPAKPRLFARLGLSS